jgi:hypothetical protein
MPHVLSDTWGIQVSTMQGQQPPGFYKAITGKRAESDAIQCFVGVYQ